MAQAQGDIRVGLSRWRTVNPEGSDCASRSSHV